MGIACFTCLICNYVLIIIIKDFKKISLRIFASLSDCVGKFQERKKYSVFALYKDTKMSNILKKILIFDKDKNTDEVTSSTLETGKGLPGDRHYDDSKDQITILFDNKNGKHADGLCTSRFKANLTIETEEDFVGSLSSAVQINDAVFELTGEKGCYDECPLHSNGEKCHLVGNAFFASTKNGGTVHTGDNVTVTK